ncbi:MAG: hypothetical protein J1G01_04345 [Clostridiales bacterium]|nr:hypothetical protein [Clostridiales bacterium]
MAKTEKKKKKGIVQRMMFGDDTKPDLTPERMKMSKWAMFKFLFFHRFGTMVLLNILTALFAIPAVLVILLFYMNTAIASGYIPYSGNIGIGYPIVTDAVRQGMLTSFTYQTTEFLLLVPCIAVFALGVAGNLYVMRKLVWEEPTHTARDFFRGIKKCWLPAISIGIVFGLTLLFLVFSLGYFDVYNLPSALKVFSIILSILLFIFIILFTSFFMTQNAAFKMRPMVLIRNSFLFVVGTHLQSIFMIGLGLLPVYLMFIPGITMILVMVYFFLGFSFSTLAITVYCHHCYEKFLYSKIEDKPSTAYFKRQNEFAESREKEKKKSAAPYKNPKKRKRSIDEGASITPLTPTFRREDLERLEQEHLMVMKESEDCDVDPSEIEIDAPENVAAANVGGDFAPTDTKLKDGSGDADVKDEQ